MFEQREDVTDLGYEIQKIKVEISDGYRFCVPDFWLTLKSGEVVVIDVKPLKMLSQHKVKERLDACRKYFEGKGVHYEIWTEKELGIHG